MSQLESLYEKAKLSPSNYSFSDLCSLVEMIGYEFKRQKGAHRIYKHKGISGFDSMINIQNDHGKAKPYQVRQVLNKIEKYELIRGR